MLPLTLGFQLVASPVAASMAARLLRVCPPILEKFPPTYTVEPLTAKALTPRLGSGAHGATVKSERMWARFALGTPPTESNAPPMNQPPLPSPAIANTLPCTLGNPGSAVLLAASTGTPPPVCGPT